MIAPRPILGFPCELRVNLWSQRVLREDAADIFGTSVCHHTQSEVTSLPMVVFSYFEGVGEKSDHTVSLACREHVLPQSASSGAKPPPSNKGKHRQLITTQSQIAFWPAFCRALLRLWTNHTVAPKMKIKEQVCIYM